MRPRRNPIGWCPKCYWLQPASDTVLVEGEFMPSPRRSMTRYGVCPECDFDIATWDEARGKGYGRERARRRPPDEKPWDWEWDATPRFVPVGYGKHRYEAYVPGFGALPPHVPGVGCPAALYSLLSEADALKCLPAGLRKHGAQSGVDLVHAWLAAPPEIALQYGDPPDLGALREGFSVTRVEEALVRNVDLAAYEHDRLDGRLVVIPDVLIRGAFWLIPGGANVRAAGEVAELVGEIAVGPKPPEIVAWFEAYAHGFSDDGGNLRRALR